jgi:2,4-diaminopentanoate dehydrogenase
VQISVPADRNADIVTVVADKKYRVVLWGPGSIGSELLTAIIDHRDDLENVGVKVYS